MEKQDKTIFEVLKKTETRRKAVQRSAENPVYQDSYGRRPATLLRKKSPQKQKEER